MSDVLHNKTDGNQRPAEPNWQRLSTDMPTIDIFWQGVKIQAHEGDTVAAALLAAGINTTRKNPVSGAARSPFCMMGSCFECMVKVDGVTEQACMVLVSEGMAITPVPVRELP